MHRDVRNRRFAILLVLLLGTAACSGDGTPSAESATTTSQAVGTTAGAPSTTQPTTADDPRTVSLAAGDLMLEGTVYPGGATWVLLAHMFPADRTSWDDLALLLQKEGYTVMSYDNRGYGGSEGTKEPFDLVADAEGAIGHALANGASGLVFGAASMNGPAAITLAAFYDFDAVFVLSGVPTFQGLTDPLSHLYDIDEPILFVAAEDDGTAVDDALDYLDGPSNPEIFIIAEGGHGTDMLESVPGLSPRIIGWLAEAS